MKKQTIETSTEWKATLFKPTKIILTEYVDGVPKKPKSIIL